MSDEPTRCPVCDVEFGNPGGCATHMQRTKDAAHTAHRADATLGGAASSPASHPDPAASPPASFRIASPDAAPRIGASGDAGDARSRSDARDAMQSDAALQDAGLPAFFEGLGNALPATPPAASAVAVQYLAQPPPSKVEPLMPPMDAPLGDRPKPPPVTVPLGPVLAGATAAAINCLILCKPEDEDITVEQVQGTHFPDAVEACLRLYFPELPLDHPITALIASGASLSLLVVQLKGKNKVVEAPPAASRADATPAPAASTGDAYWDAILRSQGGGVRQ
ncbi:MAG: hypothetical protein ACYDBQ_03480 [Thermoplasmatota archaeon]